MDNLLEILSKRVSDLREVIIRADTEIWKENMSIDQDYTGDWLFKLYAKLAGGIRPAKDELDEVNRICVYLRKAGIQYRCHIR
jgi:hypothetical protein